MVIRPARFQDIPQLVDIAHTAQAASKYSHFATLDEVKLKLALVNVIQNSRLKGEGASYIAVSEREGHIEGVIIAAAVNLYQIVEMRMVTDLLWYVPEGGSPKAAIGLLKSMHSWAATLDGPVIIQQYLTDAITDPGRSSNILERQGMQCVGLIYEKEIEK